ncbi:response regulator [Candidatus Saccharibacteria bacterium]|nr:response regulator [Candidatus Saccharibacteria bacterium]
MDKKILIAEDEAPLRDILAQKLKSLGFTIIIARDGDEALQRAQLQKPDLMLLDIIMPKKNGLEVIKALRKLKNKVPIIVLSNLDRPQDIEAGKHLGIDDYYVKSNISIRLLCSKINQKLYAS